MGDRERSAPPAGCVTLCFTDIEGSTRLARQLGDAWTSVLARHNEVLGSAWRRNGGFEVKTEGDAFFVVFADAHVALAAALEAQRAVLTEHWSEGVELRVRMGLHTGEAELVDGRDYAGLEVHRAARVAACAHGGQVLLSGATAELVRADLPEDTSLEQLGRFHLKDFDEPELLSRVVHPDLPAGTPAPRAMPAEAHNLPLLRTSFIGRDLESVEIDKLVEEHALVTVLGPGGLGKTRLCLETARAMTDRFRDGVWAVFLAGETVNGDVMPLVARELGVGDVPGVERLDAIATALADKNLLLLLDNCEHVLASAAALVKRLLDDCPDVHVLTTSRQALRVRGERVWSLAPLAVPGTGVATWTEALEFESVTLFVDRASAANPRFALTDTNAAAVGAICRAVDGLPLALELAAVATRAMPLETLSERIGDSVRVLRSGDRTDQPRQQTLEDLIGWSYDLLEPSQQAMLRRLSVFRGGWTLDAAEAVCAGRVIDRDDVLPLLSDLVERSLVLIDADDRYRMLVLIRAFAEQKLRSTEEVSQLEVRFVEYFVDRCQSMSETALTDESANLRHATSLAARHQLAVDEFAIARILCNHLLVRGHYDDVREMLASVATRLAERPDLRAHALAGCAQIARVKGERSRSLELSTEALRLAQECGDAAQIAQAAAQHSQTLADADPEAASEVLRPVLELEVPVLARAQVLESLSKIERSMGRLDQGIDHALEAARLFEQAGDDLRALTLRLDVAESMSLQGDGAEATGLLDTALNVAAERQLPRVRAHVLYVRSRIDLHHNGLTSEQTVGDLTEAIEIMRKIGENRVVPAFVVERAVARVMLDDFAGAAADLIAAIPDIAQAGLSWHTDRVVVAVAALVAAGSLVDGDTAAALARSALTDLDEYDSRSKVFVRLLPLADQQEELLDVDAALRLATSTLERALA